MEDETNKILSDIGQTSLTEDEIDDYSIADLSTDSQVYEAINLIINERGSFGYAIDRLVAHALAFNVIFSLTKETKYYNILIGAKID